METKFSRKITDLESALSNFRDSLTLEPLLFPELVADNIKSGQIQKFEFTIELLWKTIKAFLLEADGVDVATPKAVAKEFFLAGHYSNSEYELFLQAINDRNELSHVYRQEMAESVRMKLSEYCALMEHIFYVMNQQNCSK